MSLELEIKNLTAAVAALTAKIEGINVAPAAPVAQAPAPVVTATVPVEQITTTVPTATVTMPAMPSFAAPVAAPVAAAPVAGGAPFTDGAGLIQYVMGVYKEIGATKGAMIQGVLGNLGYQNINDVKPEHYAALFAGVEALKA
jgi:hypothetical protein